MLFVSPRWIEEIIETGCVLFDLATVSLTVAKFAL